MRLADRVGSDVPGVSEKLSEYRERIAIPRKPQFMFMYRRGDEPLDLHKKELGEKLSAWLATLPVPFGAFMTEIVSAETLSSQGALDDGDLVRPHGYSVIEADSLARPMQLRSNVRCWLSGVALRFFS